MGLSRWDRFLARVIKSRVDTYPHLWLVFHLASIRTNGIVPAELPVEIVAPHPPPICAARSIEVPCACQTEVTGPSRYITKIPEISYLSRTSISNFNEGAQILRKPSSIETLGFGHCNRQGNIGRC